MCMKFLAFWTGILSNSMKECHMSPGKTTLKFVSSSVSTLNCAKQIFTQRVLSKVFEQIFQHKNIMNTVAQIIISTFFFNQQYFLFALVLYVLNSKLCSRRVEMRGKTLLMCFCKVLKKLICNLLIWTNICEQIVSRGFRDSMFTSIAFMVVSASNVTTC